MADAPSPLDPLPAPPSSWKEYVLSAVVVGVVTGASLLLPESYYFSVGLIYLLAIILLCPRAGQGPVLMAGILSAFAWEYIFIPPHFSFAINSLQDDLLFGNYIVVSLVAGQLTTQIRAQAQKGRLREQRAASEREKLLAESEKLHRALLDSISHELRTPLAVINASTDSLTGADPNLSGQLVNEIRTAVRRLNRLVGNLLNQSRLESGILKPRLDWCDAGDIVNAAVESTSDAIAGHPLAITVPEDMPPVRADFALTEHVLINLLLNAANHTPATTPVFLTTGIESGGQRMFFTVADRGPGFSPAMRGRLFKKFIQDDATSTAGLGLGLSIVRGFVVAQGGEVVAGENPGGGAMITVYLPHPSPKAAAYTGC